MKKILTYILTGLCLGTAVSSCFGIQDENYPELTPITITAVSDTVNVMIGETLSWTGIRVESDLQPLTYEWSYGVPAAGSKISDHQFASFEVISSTPTIDYTFSRTGSYILRLKVDNSESIAFKYFTLNVNAGFDEGIVILSNDEAEASSLTFIKTLTAEERERGEERVMPMNTFGDFTHGRALFMSNFTDSGVQDAYGNPMQFTALLVATDDADGTLYHIEPKSMELNTSLKIKDIAGTSCIDFAGEYSRVHFFTAYLFGADGYLYQYDMESGGSVSRIEEIDRMEHVYQMTTAESPPGVTRYPAFFNAQTAGIRRSSSQGAKFFRPEGWSVVNMGISRSSYSNIYILLRNNANPSRYKIVSQAYSTFGRAGYERELLEFENPDLKMDSDSKMVGVKKSNDLYYVYDNAVYRWGLTAQPSLSPAITLPDGEIVRDICTNLLGKDRRDDGEDKLIIATYNPSRSGKKGSVFIYDVLTQQLDERFEGICDDPAAVIYKYRLN